MKFQSTETETYYAKVFYILRDQDRLLEGRSCGSDCRCFDCGNRFSSKKNMWNHKDMEHPTPQKEMQNNRVPTRNRFDGLAVQGNWPAGGRL